MGVWKSKWILQARILLQNGAGGYRSRYLLHAKQALYHLSYGPLEILCVLAQNKTSRDAREQRRQKTK